MSEGHNNTEMKSASFPFDKLPFHDAKNANWRAFDYPIDSFIYRDGRWTYEPVIDEEEIDIPEKDMLDHSKFEKVYYYREGENDGENWTFLVKHTNGYYIFFDAGCDYTGFDCQGGGSITYSLEGQKMWELGLTDEYRNIILR